jgi:hypothetical protein
MHAPVEPLPRHLALALEVTALIDRVDTAARELRCAIRVSQRARDEAAQLRQELRAALAWHAGRR